MAGRRYDLVIVGMGSAGMVAAELSSKLGLRVAAVERERIGGDCLWTGCVPSKALLASAKAAHAMRTADRFGLTAVEPEIDTRRVFERIRSIQAGFAATDDNAERFTRAGVEILFGAARLTGPKTVEVEGVGELHARFILLSTGSRPTVPAIPGLKEAGYLTSESLWGIERAPESLVAIGGGPTSIEIAQALARLGVRVTVLQKGRQILPRDEPALAHRISERLGAEGVELALEANAGRVSVEEGMKVVRGRVDGRELAWRGHELLVDAGRSPNVEGLGLEEAGVELGDGGVVVNDAMRTSVESVYAAGDMAGRHLFTHSAGYEAAAAVRNMFFPGSTRAPRLVPWCTYTDPELAHAGLTEAEARERHGPRRVRVWRHDLSRSDRARTDSATDGEIRVVTAKGRIVGAHALCPNAGEVIHELALAIGEKKKLTDLSSLVHVYPTLSLGTGLLAGEASYERAGKLAFLARARARVTDLRPL